MEGDVPTANGIKMEPEPVNSGKNPVPEFNFDSDQTTYEYDKLIKERIKEELGLLENPTPEQLQEIIHNKNREQLGERIIGKTKKKGKTVYFRDIAEEIAESTDNIIDAEIVEEPIKVRIKIFEVK